MFGYVKKADFLSNMKTILGFSGIDLDSILNKVNQAVEEKATKAAAVRSDAASKKAAADERYAIALEAATAELNTANKAVNGMLADAAGIEAAAQQLAKASKYFA